MHEYQWSAEATSYLAFEGGSGNLSNALARLFDVVDSSRVGAGTDSAVDLWVRERAQRIFDLPTERAARQLRAALYRETPLARSPSPQDIIKVGPGAANAWMERTWTPSNSVLTIVGDVDPDAAQAEALQWLGPWKRSPAKVPGLPTLHARGKDEPIPMVSTARDDAQQVTLELSCAFPVKTPGQLAAAHVLVERIQTRLHQTSRLTLGATYGFGGQVSLMRELARIAVAGAVEQRGLPRVLALMKRDADALGKEPISPEELERFRWREGIASSLRYQRSFVLSRTLAELRLAGLPADTLEGYPSTLSTLTPDEVTGIAAECRRTAVIQLVGPPSVVQRVGAGG